MGRIALLAAIIQKAIFLHVVEFIGLLINNQETLIEVDN